MVTSPSWHQIRVDIGMIYGLRVSHESDATKFSVIIQHTLRSLQGKTDSLELKLCVHPS